MQYSREVHCCDVKKISIKKEIAINSSAASKNFTAIRSPTSTNHATSTWSVDIRRPITGPDFTSQWWICTSTCWLIQHRFLHHSVDSGPSRYSRRPAWSTQKAQTHVIGKQAACSIFYRQESENCWNQNLIQHQRAYYWSDQEIPARNYANGQKQGVSRCLTYRVCEASSIRR